MSLVLKRPICEDELLFATNELLSALSLPCVYDISDIDSRLLVKIFETIYGQKTKVTTHAEDYKEESIAACQTVLDTLSDEILLVPLTHISAERIVDGSLEDLGNLLEILSTFYECITSSIVHRNFVSSQENIIDTDNSKQEDIKNFLYDGSSQLSTKESTELTIAESLGPPRSSTDSVELDIKETERKLSLNKDIDNPNNIRIQKWVDNGSDESPKKFPKNKKSHIKFNDDPVIIPNFTYACENERNCRPIFKKNSKKNNALTQGTKIVKKSEPILKDLNFFNVLIDNFPHIDLSSEMMHVLWKRFSSQSGRLRKALKEAENSKIVSKKKIDDIITRQEHLIEYIRKDTDHLMKMKAIEAENKKEYKIRSLIRDRRTQHARAYRYYNEMSVVNRSRMLSAQHQEETIFRQNFDDCLNIQKQAVRDIIDHKKQKLKQVASQKQTQLINMERRCKDKITGLRQKTNASENQEKEIAKELKLERENMKREMRARIEKDIKEIQQSLCEDYSNLFYRSLDAESFKSRMEKAAKQLTLK